MSDDILARAEAVLVRFDENASDDPPFEATEVISDLADEVRALRARVAEVEGALREMLETYPVSSPARYRARAALAAGGPPPCLGQTVHPSLCEHDHARPAPPPNVPMTGTEISIRAKYEGRDQTAELEALRQRLTAPPPACDCTGVGWDGQRFIHAPDCPANPSSSAAPKPLHR